MFRGGCDRIACRDKAVGIRVFVLSKRSYEADIRLKHLINNSLGFPGEGKILNAETLIPNSIITDRSGVKVRKIGHYRAQRLTLEEFIIEVYINDGKFPRLVHQKHFRFTTVAGVDAHALVPL